MPDWKLLVSKRLPDAEQDLVLELAQHLEDRYRDLRNAGAGENEAIRCAMSELDDVYPIRNKRSMQDPVPIGDTGSSNFVEDFWRDLRYAVRTMWKSPTFVLFVVLTLALGIGANTTVFTIINTMILNPLPVRNPSELGWISAGESKRLAYADLKDYQAKNQVFSSLAGFTSPRVITLQGEAGSEGLFAELATGNYFSTLGITPVMGRFFFPDEKGLVAVLNYGTWQNRFAAAPDIIGKVLRLNSGAYTIIGVDAAAFYRCEWNHGARFMDPCRDDGRTTSERDEEWADRSGQDGFSGSRTI